MLLVVAGRSFAYGWRFGDFPMPDAYLVATLVLAFTLNVYQTLVGSYLSRRGRHFFRQWAVVQPDPANDTGVASER